MLEVDSLCSSVDGQKNLSSLCFYIQDEDEEEDEDIEDDTRLTGTAAKSKETQHLFDSLVRRTHNIFECYYATYRLNCFFCSANYYCSPVARTQRYLQAKIGGVEDEMHDDVEDEEKQRVVWRRFDDMHNADNRDYEVRFRL